MKITNSKGFTLIELIMVIVILGILAAVVVPKFFDFTGKAHKANKDAIYGAVKAGLNLYASDQLISSGSRTFPDGDALGADLTIILDEVPDEWTVAQNGANDDSCTITYSGDNSTIGYKSPVGGNSGKYTLTKSW